MLHWENEEPFVLGPPLPGARRRQGLGYRGEFHDQLTKDVCGVQMQLFYQNVWYGTGLIWLFNLDPDQHRWPRVSGAITYFGDAGLDPYVEGAAEMLVALYVDDEPLFDCPVQDIRDALFAYAPDPTGDIADFLEPEIDPSDYGVLVDTDVPGIEIVGRENLFQIVTEANGATWRYSEWFEVEVLEFVGDEFVYDGQSVASRFYDITDVGRELSEPLPDEALSSVFTTPYAVVRRREGNQFFFALDTKGELSELMRGALIAVVAEEFRDAGATSIRVADE